MISAELKFEYLYNLIAPRTTIVDPVEKGIYTNTNKGLIEVIANDYDIEKNNFFDMESYLDYMTIDDFKRNELINNDYFKRNLVSFVRQYFVNSEYIDFTKEKFEAERNFIESNFDGDLRDFAVVKLIQDYFKKGFGDGEIDKALLKKIIKEYTSKKLKPSYENVLVEIEKELEFIDFKMPSSIFDEKLVAITGDTIELAEIFKLHQDKIKVIDFWASWCIPCIREMKAEIEFKNQLKKDRNVAWIYFSIDENFENWKKKSEDLRTFTDVENHYLLSKGVKSKIASYLKVQSIPRYMIFDQDGKIVLSNSPRPSDRYIFQNIIEQIDSKIQ